jgi:hypothetical protein
MVFFSGAAAASETFFSSGREYEFDYEASN